MSFIDGNKSAKDKEAQRHKEECRSTIISALLDIGATQNQIDDFLKEYEEKLLQANNDVILFFDKDKNKFEAVDFPDEVKKVLEKVKSGEVKRI